MTKRHRTSEKHDHENWFDDYEARFFWSWKIGYPALIVIALAMIVWGLA